MRKKRYPIGGTERGRAVAKKTVLLLLALVLGCAACFSEVFRFEYVKGEKYHIVSTVTENVTINGRFVNKNDILNKIAVEVRDAKDGTGYHAAIFQASTRLSGSEGVYELNEDYASEFWRDALGKYSIDDKYFMPTVRDVPLFPEGDVAVGQSWTAMGSEAHDFRKDFGVISAFHFPFTVNYAYLRNEEKKGVDCAVISASYTVFHKVSSVPQTTKTYPIRITGTSNQILWWDIAGKKIIYGEEKFDIIFTLHTGDEVEFSGDSRGELTEVKPLDREKVAREIQKELKDRKVEGATVRPDERGVTITIENVNFPPNSDTLMPAEQEKLRRIAEILKKYPDRDILVTGHTAGVGGYTEKQHQELSELRAKAAGDFLLSLGARKAEQMTFQGMGDRVPIGDNSTEEGRKKNRRVEITIVEN